MSDKCNICDGNLDTQYDDYLFCENDHYFHPDCIGWIEDDYKKIALIWAKKIWEFYYKDDYYNNYNNDRDKLERIIAHLDGSLEYQIDKLRNKLISTTNVKEIQTISSKLTWLTSDLGDIKSIINYLHGGWGEFPEEFCPICNKTVIGDREIIEYLVREKGLDLDAIKDEIRRKNGI